jgi:hypothetical protein
MVRAYFKIARFKIIARPYKINRSCQWPCDPVYRRCHGVTFTGGGWFVRARRARRARSAATAHRPPPPPTHHPQQCGPKRAALARRGGPVTDPLAKFFSESRRPHRHGDCRATLLICTRANLLAAKLPDCRANLQRPCRPIQVMSSFKLPELWTRPDSPSPARVTRDFKAHCGVALAAAAWAG